MSRTGNAVRNILCGIVNKFVVLLFPFIIKSVIVKEIGSDYLGLNNLFSSILQILNLAELGFSSAIVVNMYKPIAENDTQMICALMNLYKKIYRIIGTIILLLGLVITPFLPFFIKGTYSPSINIYILYILYLLNTAVAYFLFAYKSVLFTASQRNDILSNINTIVIILQYMIQIYILCVLKNYYLYMIVGIIMVVLNNIICSFLADRKYPYYKCEGNIEKKTLQTIKKRVLGLMINKVCQTSRNSLDSIFLSTFLGLHIVAIYGNYYSVMAAITGFLSLITTSITAGIGNSIVSETVEKNYNDMNKFNFIYMIISGWCTIYLLCLYQPFMKIWMGQEYMFTMDIVALFCVYFYSLKMGVLRGAYSDAAGLWWENRYRAIIETIVNTILNFILGKHFGVHGIILGTLISLLIINFGFGSQILFKHYFKSQKVSEYFSKHGMYAIVTLFILIVTYYVCSFVHYNNDYIEIIIRGIICFVVPAALYTLIYYRTKMFREAKSFIIHIIKG